MAGPYVSPSSIGKCLLYITMVDRCLHSIWAKLVDRFNKSLRGFVFPPLWPGSYERFHGSHHKHHRNVRTSLLKRSVIREQCPSDSHQPVVASERIELFKDIQRYTIAAQPTNIRVIATSFCFFCILWVRRKDRKWPLNDSPQRQGANCPHDLQDTRSNTVRKAAGDRSRGEYSDLDGRPRDK